MATLRVFLADDHNVVREGLKALINAQPDMEVIGEAADGEAAWHRTRELRPDVVVMDVSMPVMNGARATERIKQDCPEVKVLALTVHEDRSYLQQLLQSGASAYVLKRAVADDLIHAIRSVARGGVYLDSTLAGRVVGGLVTGADTPGRSAEVGLSDRESEVLRLIAKGHTNREIAAKLDVSIKTIETHKARAMEKLGLDSRAGIVGYAIQHGWLTGD